MTWNHEHTYVTEVSVSAVGSDKQGTKLLRFSRDLANLSRVL